MKSFVKWQIQQLKEHASLDDIIILDTSYLEPRILLGGSFLGNYSMLEHLPPNKIKEVDREIRRWYNFLSALVGEASYFVAPPLLRAEAERSVQYLVKRIDALTEFRRGLIGRWPVSSSGILSGKYRQVRRLLQIALNATQEAVDYGLGNSSALPKREGLLYDYLCEAAEHWLRQKAPADTQSYSGSITDALTLAYALHASALTGRKAQIFTMDSRFHSLLTDIFVNTVLRNQPDSDRLRLLRQEVPPESLGSLIGCDVEVYYLRQDVLWDGNFPKIRALSTAQLRE